MVSDQGLHCLLKWIFVKIRVKFEKVHQTPLKLEMDLSNMWGRNSPLDKNGLTYPSASTGEYCHFPPSSFLTTTVHSASYIVISVGAKHTGISRVDFGPTRTAVFFLRRRQNGELVSLVLVKASSKDDVLSVKENSLVVNSYALKQIHEDSFCIDFAPRLKLLHAHF